MNKIQIIKLLETRGITEPNGMSAAKAIQSSGGNATIDEMVQVNEKAMTYFAEKLQESKSENEALRNQYALMTKRVEELSERDFWLECLEQAGVDNWDGIELAHEIKGGYEE